MEQFQEHNTETTQQQKAPEAQPFSPDSQDAKKEDGFFMELLRFGLLALVIVMPIRWYVAQPFIVSGASMEETFAHGEYLIVDQLSYRFDEPERGDVVIFKYPEDPSKYFIKRIIGLPGDTVRIAGDTVTITNPLYPEGITLEEPYVDHMRDSAPFSQTLGDAEYFVMGDNRDASSDSRIWGTLPRENIVGRAYLRLFPFSRAALLPGAYEPDETAN